MTLFILPLFLGPTELILILLVVLLLFGGRKIPELMRGLGRGVKEFKDSSKEDGKDGGSKKKGITARKGCGAGENDIALPRIPGLAGAENAPPGTSEKPRQAAPPPGEQTGKRRASGTRHPENRQASGIAPGQQKPCTQRAGHTGRHR